MTLTHALPRCGTDYVATNGPFVRYFGCGYSRTCRNEKPKPFISVIIAALNEEEAIANVINSVPKDLSDEIVVVDNGSKDRTAGIAKAAGARVVTEPVPGYGRAFRTGLRSISPKCEIVVFLDGDGSDCPEMMDRLVTPIIEGNSDFVIGSRTRGNREAGSMIFHQVVAGYMIGLSASDALWSSFN